MTLLESENKELLRKVGSLESENKELLRKVGSMNVLVPKDERSLWCIPIRRLLCGHHSYLAAVALRPRLVLHPRCHVFYGTTSTPLEARRLLVLKMSPPAK